MKVCRTIIVAQAGSGGVGVDSVLKLKLKSRLKFKCRQCVKAPLVKDTLEVDNCCPSKHLRIGILLYLYLYFHLYLSGHFLTLQRIFLSKYLKFVT